ncbi:hypothetical protein B0T22DRAFT_161441 [Podospora appendiculata]|uniref:Uncharacterized protein n=1 Tax=Podospora appendiculata TaxID=314037 RepID=A0AAE0X9W0_9PEZI|nr:hypothetical protein B0T22DRAFT_161441 [Podospora appendiculata]
MVVPSWERAGVYGGSAKHTRHQSTLEVPSSQAKFQAHRLNLDPLLIPSSSMPTLLLYRHGSSARHMTRPASRGCNSGTRCMYGAGGGGIPWHHPISPTALQLLPRALRMFSTTSSVHHSCIFCLDGIIVQALGIFFQVLGLIRGYGGRKLQYQHKDTHKVYNGMLMQTNRYNAG